MAVRLMLTLALVVGATVPVAGQQTEGRWQDWGPGIIYGDPGHTFPVGPVVEVALVDGPLNNLSATEFREALVQALGIINAESGLTLRLQLRSALLPPGAPYTPETATIRVRGDTVLSGGAHGVATQSITNPYFDLVTNPTTGVLEFVYYDLRGFLAGCGVYLNTADAWGTDTNCVSPRLDVTTALLHELGHCVGLSHTGTPMMLSVPPCDSPARRRHLADADRAVLKDAYKPRHPNHLTAH